MSRSDAQSTADRLRALREELADPEIRQILDLTPDQEARFEGWSSGRLAELAREFDVDTTSSQGSLSWGMRIASAFGGVALSVALVLFFQRYWGAFDTWLQVVCVILLPVICVAAAEYSAKRERTLYFAGLLSLIALAAFVLNLYVVGRVFNITSTERALLAWGVFALALAYRYGLRPLLAIGLSLLISYGSAAFTATLGYHWLDFGQRPEHFAGLGLLTAFAPDRLRHRVNTDFDSVYRVIGWLAFFIAVMVLSEGEPVSYLPFGTHAIQSLYEVTGLLAAAGCIWLGIRRQWNGLANLGTVFFCFFL
ncbi:MAG TPA: DUF2157 domain-containing protein, partial [Bryobacteraceae bacterium]|nr:DUF2157 domain-containing protein [Bryobacteraceae bacterium]